MTDADALMKASVRERRRLSVMFTILIVAFVAVLGTAWLVERGRGDSWRDQALQWQDEYITLYDEFTTSTGEEPEAPEPSDVAQDSPEAIPGEPGPAGAAGLPGARGPGPTADQVLDGIARCFTAGTCTAPVGDPGPAGTPGADSSVPGPTGPAGPAGPAGVAGPAGAPGVQGPAGPTCPDGFTATLTWIPVSDSELDIPTQRQAIVCLPITSSEGVTP